MLQTRIFFRLSLISVIILLSGNICYAQDLTEKTTAFNIEFGKFSLKENKDSNLLNLPFQFGIEIGRSIKFDSKDDFTKIGLIGYLDINILGKIIFLRFEGGSLILNDEVETEGEDFHRRSNYVFAGINVFFLRVKNNRLSISLGAGVISGGFLPFLTLSTRYVYIFNKYIGITASLRYPFIRGKNPYFSLGLQFFNN